MQRLDQIGGQKLITVLGDERRHGLDRLAHFSRYRLLPPLGR